MANNRGGLSKREYAAVQAGKPMSSAYSSKSFSNSSSSSGASGASGAPKAPKIGDFSFDSSKLVPQYQSEAASIYNPQIQQIQGLQALTSAQAKDATVKTNDEFAQLLKTEQENINRRGAFFSGGAIDQENRIGAQQAGALRDIGFNEQSANLKYQGTLSEIAQAQKDYVSSKVEGAYSSAYKTFQDKVANTMNQYQLELGQYNTDRAFNQSKIESDRNYALAAAASARAGSGQAQSRNQANILADAQGKILSSRGTDGKSDPNVYAEQKAAYIRAGGSPADFDASFGGTLSDNEKRNLGLQNLMNSGLSTPVQTTVRGIAGNFDNEQQVKNFQQVQSANGLVQKISKSTKNPADNQALIYAFAKAMDPNSVVREGEYATVQKYAQSWAETQGFNAARILTNQEFLTEQAIQNIKDTVQSKYETEKQSYENVYNEYARRIDQQTGMGNGKDYLTNYSLNTQQNNVQNVNDPLGIGL